MLDGRYLRAFNGSGVAARGRGCTTPAYGNFRVNGPGYDPDVIGMDEDYDACDLENWFLAIQSADGQVIIPSFHRPGILRADPSVTDLPERPGRRPRRRTTGRTPRPTRRRGSSAPARSTGTTSLSFPDLLPDPATGKITYDVDNDGDGITDSVWLDLGYPPDADAKGRLFKPLFAFMVIGLNGRLPLNTAGNLQHRDSQRQSPCTATPTHLGNSPSEIDPTYALQARTTTNAIWITRRWTTRDSWSTSRSSVTS